MKDYNAIIAKIIDYLKNSSVPETLSSDHTAMIANFETSELKSLIFYDVRENVNSLRLTYTGMVILTSYFERWQFEDFDYNYSFIKILSKESNAPWFIDRKKCILFDSDLAFDWTLSGDFKIFSEMYKNSV